MKLVVIIFMFFMISGLLIVSNNNLAMYDQENRQEFRGLYGEWLGDFYVNVLSITGKVVDLEWLPR